MKLFFIIGLIIFSVHVTAQSGICLVFHPRFHEDKLTIGEKYELNGDTLEIHNLKCYITDLSYYLDDSLVYSSSKKAHLLDADDSTTFVISERNFFTFDKIKFNVGVDSLTNVSGALEGDLDPINGMYWTWQSGYINFKLEGTSTLCAARNNKFYWHIGGYASPFSAIREVTIEDMKGRHCDIVIQIDELFRNIDVSKTYQVMSPSEKALEIADLLPLLFKGL